ncbi:MAG TPA: tail fiber domain-containing protein [Cyclobacteriaceae bacterium]
MKLPNHPKLVILAFLLLHTVFFVNAQQTLSIGDSQLKSNAVLYLKGNGSQGLILPIVSNVTGSFGEAGMIVYNSTDSKIYFNSGSSWTALGSGSGSSTNYTLSLSGNNLLLQNNATTVSTVPLAASPAANQFLMWDGSKWVATTLSQDITNVNGAITVSGLNSKALPALPSTGGVQLLIYDTSSSSWKFQTLTTSSGTVTNIATGTGLKGGPITTTGTISVDVGTTANKIVQLDANGKLPALDGSQLTSLPSGFTNPMTAQGDIIFGGTTGTPSRLAGTAGFLKSTGAVAPTWSTVNLASTTDVTGILPVTNGGTGKNSFSVTSADITDLSIVDADVNATAAIAGSKINPTFTQNISTTGTGTMTGGLAAGSSSQFAVSSTGNITKINNITTSFPSVQGAANTVLLNNGSGTLSWSTAPSPFSTSNIVPRGNGSALVASAIQDDGTNTGVGVAPAAGNKLTVTTSTAGQLQGIYATNSQVGAGSSTAVRGDASGSTNTNFGIYGTATGGGLGATGLYGSATNSASSQGVYGTVSGTGITNAYGVKGSATSTSATNYGVYGDASGGTTNWAGYFKGNAAIEGGLALGSTTDFGTSGQVLTSTGSGTAPIWATAGSSPLISNSGTNNIFGGVSAGASNTTGINNTFYGFQAGMANTTGTENTFIGRAAGLSNVGGSYDVYVGKDAGNSMTSGNLNTFVGYQAGHNADGISASTFLGRLAGGSTTTGSLNTFLGEQAGANNLTGSSNTFVGRNTGSTNTTGGTITLLGSGANVGADGLSNATAIGANATVTTSNSLVLGSSSIKVGIGTSSPITALHVAPNSTTYAIRIDQGTSGDGFLSYVNTTSSTRTIFSAQSNVSGLTVLGNGWTGIGRTPTTNNLEVEGTASKTAAGGFIANSDRRIKTDIQEIDNSFDLMKRLHPVKFKYTDEWKKKHPSLKDQYYYNFIAQEFQQVFPEAAQSSEEYLDGDKKSILQIDTYHAQITTIKAVQELILKVEELEKENSKLKTEKGQLEAKMTAIEDGQKTLLKDLEEMKRILGITAQQK